ncbi:RNA polymerase sigma factor [candidate division KSB1 bacterium]
MSDIDLINNLQSGRDNAFKELVDHYQHKVVNTCYGFVKNSEDAEDIAQEVFIEIYRSISKFKQESSLSTWIYRISVNKSLDFIRKKNRKKRFGFEHSISDNESNAYIDPADPSEPHEEIERNERHEILRNMITKLPKNQKIALVLHKIEGLPHAKVAEVMNTSHSSVESLIHRAKKNLKKYLNEFYDA